MEKIRERKRIRGEIVVMRMLQLIAQKKKKGVDMLTPQEVCEVANQEGFFMKKIGIREAEWLLKNRYESLPIG